MKNIIHHYTTINTLALILKTKKIRFTRLDKVDDISESKIYGEYDLSKYLFVSCWTKQQEESIPQWHMYTDRMKGVRLSLEKDMFNYQPLNPLNESFIKIGEVLSPIPYESLFTDDYIILPDILNKKNFEREVIYVDNPSEYYKNAVDLKRNDDGSAKLNIQKTHSLAMYKTKEWEFQKELRFVLLIFPGIPIPKEGRDNKKYVSELPSFILNSIIEGRSPKIESFDVELNPEVINNIEVTLGPLHNEGDYIMVKSLLEKYTANGTLNRSKLSGTIRDKK